MKQEREWEFEDQIDSRKKQKELRDEWELSEEDEEILEQYNFDPRKLK